jgi:predicted ferric reductase
MKLEEPVNASGPNGKTKLPGRIESAIPASRETFHIWPWFARRPWGIFLMALYPILVLSPLAILTMLQPESDRPRIAEAGVECGTVALPILAVQFVIAGRFRWIEAPFGLDVLLSFHRAMAMVAVALLCVHPLLVAAGNEWSLLTRLNVHWYIWAGRATLTLLLAHILFNLWRRSLKLSHERWRQLHSVFALGILTLGFTHAFAVGGEQPGARIVWSVTFALAMACWLHSRVVRPRLLIDRGFRVAEVREESPSVWTVELEQRHSRPLRFAPGQFQFLRFPDSNLPAEEHPFTIASSPKTPTKISVTIKESGDFTAQVRHLQAGDLATVHGPFGRFSHTLHVREDELVFVAAGVGITPLMSMLRWMRDNGEIRPVLLIYANRRPENVLFAQELATMERELAMPFKVIHVLSEAPPDWQGETGRLDAQRIVRLCNGIDGKGFYLCCPATMTTAMVRGLRRIGVSARRIHTDHFAL